MVPFSHRTPSDQRLNRLASVRARVGTPAFDLTESNPTRVGFDYPDDLLAELADRRGFDYSPEPRGPLEARRAIAEHCGRLGVDLPPERVVLTASTSEAYSFLFKLLANPGETMLVPTPSYPLFDHLARLDAVRLAPYALRPDERWRPDTTAVDSASSNTRGLIVVHPNNPTGSFISLEDGESIADQCRRRNWALIADEVFLPYPLEGKVGEAISFAAMSSCLTFTLGGLSKSIGLPQAKLSWIMASGPEPAVTAALERLDFIADAYLSVSTPIAAATPALITQGQVVQDAIRTRCKANLAILDEIVASTPSVTLLPPEGGWSAVLRVPSVLDDETLAISLLEQHEVAVHPGYFFDFPSDGYIVVSLLVPEEIFAEGCRRLMEFVGDLVHT